MTPQQHKAFLDALDAYDWEGMAKMWQAFDVKWHAAEWKNFIEGIEQKGYALGQKNPPAGVEALYGYDAGFNAGLESAEAVLPEGSITNHAFQKENDRWYARGWNACLEAARERIKAEKV